MGNISKKGRAIIAAYNDFKRENTTLHAGPQEDRYDVDSFNMFMLAESLFNNKYKKRRWLRSTTTAREYEKLIAL